MSARRYTFHIAPRRIAGETLAAACEGVAGITPEVLRSLLSPEDSQDIEAGDIGVETLWQKLLSLYEGGAHIALGYASWAAYCDSEFQISDGRAYQLLQSGRVIRALLEEEGGERTNVRQPLPKSEGVTRALRPLLDRPDEMREAWRESSRSSNEKPTAREVGAVVSRRLVGVTPMSGEHEWYTPPKYIDAARNAMGGIDLDPASCEIANRTVRAERFYTQEDNGLVKPWCGRVFCNPPYSPREIAGFCERMVKAYDGQEIEQGILLTSNSTDTAWWHTTFRAAKVACLTQGRIGFLQPDGEPVNNNRSGSTFFYFGPHRPAFFTAFAPIGMLIQPFP